MESVFNHGNRHSDLRLSQELVMDDETDSCRCCLIMHRPYNSISGTYRRMDLSEVLELSTFIFSSSLLS